MAQLHWPRLFLVSDGFARLEINYARIIGRAYSSFKQVPTEAELQALIREYADNYLLFLFEAGGSGWGQIWGQWDAKKDLTPRYKTALDRKSPIPPEPAFTEWKKKYAGESKAFPKSFGRVSEAFPRVVVVVGVDVEEKSKNICASGDARSTNSPPSINEPPFETTEPEGQFDLIPETPQGPSIREQQDAWFNRWWDEYFWLKKGRKAAMKAFRRIVRTQAMFDKIIAATEAQAEEMLSRQPHHRPYAATWLNGARWEDEIAQPAATNQCEEAARLAMESLKGD